MASIYIGMDTRLDRFVAVKIMHPHLANDEEFVNRFIREAKAAAALSHPNIVAIQDQGWNEGGSPAVFIVMEYIDGFTLRELLHEGGPLSSEDLLRYMIPIVSALAEAHKRGIVHRDIKPENIFFCRENCASLPAGSPPIGRRSYELENQVKLGDFGTVRWVRTYDENFDGIIIGSQRYLSPEQIYDPEHLDTRTDIYSFGIVCYEVLYGVHPKNVDENTRNLLVKLARAKPVPRTPPKGFEALHEIIFKCMKDVDERYQSMGEVVGELRRFLTEIQP